MSSSNVQFRSLSELNSQVIACNLCPRLRKYCDAVARKKRRQFLNWEYWAKPLPGFGDPKARLLILGLAPGAHGGNRTGRMFTGDGSAQFLMAALHKFGYANKTTSEKVDDGLVLKDAYITAIVRCAPPKNKPSRDEINACQQYWTQEIRLLSNIRVVLALGRVAFDAYVRYLRTQPVSIARLGSFRHGAFFEFSKPYPALCLSYHPSRQNTQTGKLTVNMFDQVFKTIQKFLSSQSSNML